MSDILFRYLLAAQERDRSFFRRLFFSDEQLLAAGVEQLVESAAARVQVTSQHERVSRRKTVVPASRRNRVQFFKVAKPDRPAAYKFERRTQEFPLEDKLRVFTCPRCRGRGKLRCGTCGGRGKVRSSNDGRMRRCMACGGDGRVRCHRCRGEGQLASWEVEVYRWLVETRDDEEYPLPEPPSALRKAFARWLAADRDLVAGFEPEAVAEHLGYETPEALEVAERADKLRKGLEDEARKSADAYLFHRTDCSLAPAGYTIVRLRNREARYYWLVGRGEHAQEVPPTGRLDGAKWLGWVGVGSGGVMSYDGLVESLRLGLPEVFEHLLAWGDLPAGVLAAGVGTGGLLALRGVRRVIHREPPVDTVALLPATGVPTPALICFAYLGSYSDRLKVLDRAYDTQLERLLGRPRPRRQSESLTVELAGGRRVRLVEVARPNSLSDGQLELMAKALDGVLILKEHGQHAPELERKLRKIAARRDDTTPTAIGEFLIERQASELTEEAFERGLPLEALRRAFVERLLEDLDWGALFDHIWWPIAELLERRAPRIPPPPVPKPAAEASPESAEPAAEAGAPDLPDESSRDVT